MSTQAEVKQGRHERTGTEDVGVEPGRDILREYSETTWDFPDDAVEEATVIRIDEEICQKEIERRLTVDEEHLVEEHSTSYHREEFDFDSFFVEACPEDRHEIVPSGYAQETFRFFVPGSKEKSNCSVCHSRGRVNCDDCGGQGNVRCRSCEGTGRKTDSDGRHIGCKKCNGNGNQTCRSCNGTGDLQCGRCDGSGQTIKFEYLERTFTPDTQVEIRSESVPPEFVEPAEGQHRATDQLPLREGEVKRGLEKRDVPVTVVDYEYGGDEYTLYEVEHEIKAGSHPRDMKKWGMAAVATIAILALCAGFYIYVL